MAEVGAEAAAQAPSPRTAVKRLPKRAAYEREVIDGILDEGLFCHVGFVHPAGHPVVIPTIHTRRGDQLYLHGSPASQLLRAAKGGVEVCVTVTLLDGLVLARSAFHHSMNYRSVVVFGTAEEVTDLEEKRLVLLDLVDHVAPVCHRQHHRAAAVDQPHVGDPAGVEHGVHRVGVIPPAVGAPADPHPVGARRHRLPRGRGQSGAGARHARILGHVTASPAHIFGGMVRAARGTMPRGASSHGDLRC